MIYSFWHMIFFIIAIIAIVCVITINSEPICTTKEELKAVKNFLTVCCIILSLIIGIQNAQNSFKAIFVGCETQYLVQASCSVSNENYTIFKTEHGEYKIEGTYPYGKDYILLMRDYNNDYKDDEVLNVYISDINLLMQEKEEE